MSQYEVSKEILNIINDHGYEAYIVGGAVRDRLLGREVTDIDISTNCPMETLGTLFVCYDIGKSKDFGIVSVKYKGFDFEIAQYRHDIGSTDSRHPDSVQIVNTFDEDVMRRDFTINAMGEGVNGEIIDLVGGQQDIHNKIIRTVGDPVCRFEEDSLRIIRAIRFANVLGFKIDTSTLVAMFHCSKKIIHNVSKERIVAEIDKLFKCQDANIYDFFNIFHNGLQILNSYLPMLWIDGLKKYSRMKCCNEIKWAMLAYVSRTLGLKNRVFAEAFFSELPIKKDIIKLTHFILDYNHIIYNDMSDTDVKIFVNRHGIYYVEKLIEFFNVLGVTDSDLEKHYSSISVDELKPLVNGNDIKDRYKVSNGPMIKIIKDEILKLQYIHPEYTKEQLLSNF